MKLKDLWKLVPRRLLLSAAAAGALLAVAWHRSGVVRATGVLELPVKADERDAVRAMARVAVHESDVLLEALQQVNLGITTGQLAERIAVEPDPTGDETLLLHLDFEEHVDFARLAEGLSRALDRRMLLALPSMRQQRIKTLEDRLQVLDGVIARSSREFQSRVQGQQGVLEVERAESLRAWNDWRLRDRVPGNAVRLLTSDLRVQRLRAPPGPYAQTFLVLLLVFLALEFLGAMSRRVEVVTAQAAAAPDRGSPPAPVVIPDKMELTLPDEVLEKLRAPPSPPPAPAAPQAPTPPTPPPVDSDDGSLPFRLLGDVPSVPGIRRDVPDSYRISPGIGGGMPEAFQGLAARLGLLSPNLRVLQLVGWTRGNGTSVVAVNLARTFTRLGRRVALIDANLRRPILDRVFRVDPDEGLTDVLLDTEPEGLLHVVEPPGLQLLPAGPPPPAPEELLASPRFESLLSGLRRNVDLVILDSPPLDEGADALLLAALADGLVTIVPVDVPVLELGHHLQDLEGLGVPLLGVVCASELAGAQ